MSFKEKTTLRAEINERRCNVKIYLAIHSNKAIHKSGYIYFANSVNNKRRNINNSIQAEI